MGRVGVGRGEGWANAWRRRHELGVHRPRLAGPHARQDTHQRPGVIAIHHPRGARARRRGRNSFGSPLPHGCRCGPSWDRIRPSEVANYRQIGRDALYDTRRWRWSRRAPCRVLAATHCMGRGEKAGKLDGVSWGRAAGKSCSNQAAGYSCKGPGRQEGGVRLPPFARPRTSRHPSPGCESDGRAPRRAWQPPSCSKQPQARTPRWLWWRAAGVKPRCRAVVCCACAKPHDMWSRRCDGGTLATWHAMAPSSSCPGPPADAACVCAYSAAC